MSLNPRVCKKSYKVHIPMMGEACEFWLITVTDEQSITNPDKDHAYLTDDGKLFVFNGDSLVRVNCDICFTQEEREKLEGIEEGANKYVLPVASSTELGGVLLGYTQNGRNYPITKDTKGNIYVNVPWEEYQLPKATDNALGGIKTGYKQNGKFYPIKTDTDGNAYVQVPWEDTNTVYEVVSKTSNGLMPMLPSDENASKRFLNGDGEWVVGTDNSINGVTQTGSTFSGETSDCGVEITKVVGKTTQQTTNGYQLFDASKLPTKTIGGASVTNNEDGTFTISGTGNLSEAYVALYNCSKEESLRLLRAGIVKSNAENTIPQIRFGLRNVSNGTFVTGKCISYNYKTITLTEEDIQSIENGTNVLSFGFLGNSGNTITPATVKPMVYIDGDGTWEPFTGGKPAPNPDYAMPIENVEISKIISHGRQLFDSSKLATKSQGGATVTNNGDGSFTISGSGNLLADYDSRYFQRDVSFLKKGILKLTGLGDVKTIPEIQIIGYNTDANTDRTFILNTSGNREINITDDLLSRTKGILMVFYGGRGSRIISGTVKPMLYQDGDGTWEPFKHATIETSLTLAQDDIYQQGTITRARKQVTFDGSSDEAWKASSSPNTFYVTLSDKSTATSNEMLSNRFVKIERTTPVASLESGQMKEDGSNPKIVYFKVDGISGVDNFKTWLSTHPTTIEYELATPTTEEFKVPTIPSYEPYTEISTNSVVDPTITFRPLPFTTCLVGEATEEESGYMPPLSGNSNEFLNGNGEWSVPSGYTLPTASSTVLGGVKIGENITISSGTISIDKEDVTGALGYTPPTANTTYEKVDKSSDGLCPKLPNETTTTKYLRQDGSWAVPPNTTYSVATTSKNGLMSSNDKAKVDNLRRIYKGTSASAPSDWVDGDIYIQYEE